MWHQISSLCGPHSLHVSPCSIGTSIFYCIYLISYIIKYLSHSNVSTSFIISLIKIPKVSIQPGELVGLVELSCYAIIWIGTLHCSNMRENRRNDNQQKDEYRKKISSMFDIVEELENNSQNKRFAKD